MDEKTMSDRILSSDFGSWNYRRFLILCVRERQTKAQYLRNLAVARSNSPENLAVTQEFERYYCEKFGVTSDELYDWVERQDSRGKSAVQISNFLETASELGDV